MTEPDVRRSMTVDEYFQFEEISPLTGQHRHFAMRHVSSPGDIYPVFHDLFSDADSS